MGLDAGGSGGSGGGNYSGGRRSLGSSPGRGRQTARQTTIRPRPAPAPYSPPPSTTSSGQYVGGGGAPRSTPQVSQGPIGGSGRPARSGPSPAQLRRERIKERREARRERRQDARKDYRKKRKAYRGFMANDETFQSQKSSLQKNLEDFILRNKAQRGDVREDFGLSLERMGKERGNALEQMQEDFAARGMLNSSEYLDSVGKYNEDYQTKVGDLTRDRDRNIEDLLESLGMFRSTTREKRQNAKQEAIRRRAAEFGGWDPSDKPKFMR